MKRQINILFIPTFLFFVLTLLNVTQQTGVLHAQAEILSPVAFVEATYQPPIPAATHPTNDQILAASCSQADVQVAIDIAADGDTVLVPAGNCTWTTLQSRTPSVEINDKNITLQGTGIDQTTITDATGYDAFEQALAIYVTPGRFVRVTGFTFQGGHPDEWHGLINIWGPETCCAEFRLDHVRVSDTINHSIEVGDAIGVIDHCMIDGDVGGILVKGEYPGDAARQSELDLGSKNAVYIEDCTFDFLTTFRAAVDAQSGGRFVFRHNILNDTYAVNHGTETGFPERSAYSFEIYENTFTSSADWFTSMFLRGGTGVVFNNAANGYGNMLVAANYRSCDAYGNWGQCDGQSSFDGNLEANGYPCYDQIGRGADSGPGTPQTLEPLYEWGNTLNGANADVTVHWGCSEVALHIQENRDFYNDTPRPGYTPYTYPHPLTRELTLNGRAGDQAIYVNWALESTLPLTSTWQIEYDGPTGDQPSPIGGLENLTSAYTLTGLTNHEWYTITLSAEPWLLSDTIRLMPTNLFNYLPMVARSD